MEHADLALAGGDDAAVAVLEFRSSSRRTTRPCLAAPMTMEWLEKYRRRPAAGNRRGAHGSHIDFSRRSRHAGAQSRNGSGVGEDAMRLKSFAALAVAGCGAARAARRRAAQNYPDRPVQDHHRVLAGRRHRHPGPVHRRQALSQMWGQQVVVENRPGGSGNIGAAAASAAPPDGYTLHFGAQTLGANVTLVADHRVRSGHELRADHAGRHRAGGVHGGERRRRSSRSRR